ncbi:hypothetical protein EFO61_02410 [Lacticaseibacillus rhamnosus]|nr:hypothetical protein BVH57_00805 [Lacticaseibacillus rhamnosus]EHJ35839.1 hypothetical protein HMPREF0541_00186 [Lacticaseibacillus rhamnosus ATCC 21052]MCT3143909.1 hypothetical protein [Lacticaseibacillus rhamnosus]MCT3153112.1 hypothetical protein [Lacticaseibacillus rhamnosus]MCT3160841.1 hypothetical protein [Lacticaseibacillus rhamnosus]
MDFRLVPKMFCKNKFSIAERSFPQKSQFSTNKKSKKKQGANKLSPRLRMIKAKIPKLQVMHNLSVEPKPCSRKCFTRYEQAIYSLWITL